MLYRNEFFHAVDDFLDRVRNILEFARGLVDLAVEGLHDNKGSMRKVALSCARSHF